MKTQPIRVKKNDITLGEALPWDLFDSQGFLMLRRGFTISPDRQVDGLLNRGLYRLQSFSTSGSADLAIEEMAQGPPFEILDEIQVQLQRLLLQEDEKEDFPLGIVCLGNMLQQACLCDTDAALSTIFMKQKKGRYSIAHSLDTALICEVVSRRLGHSPEERLSLLAAAMTMNISMLDLQEQLYHQTTPLTDEQKWQVRIHPEEGAQRLRERGVTDAPWLDAVLQHHEFLDGKGYPRGLLRSDISDLARILTIADIFCAKVSGRGYREPLLPNTGLREIFLGVRGEGVHSDTAAVLVKELGIYPPGTVVRLKNGELAVVTRRGEQAHCPVARALTDPKGMPLLRPTRRDCGKDEFSIKDVISPAQIPTEIDPHQLWSRANRA